MSALGDRERTLALRTFDRVQPPNWTLEWSLPLWLGSALGHDAALLSCVTRSNVLGLVAVRLEDDIRDREIPPADAAAAGDVARVLMDAAIDIYRPLLAPRSRFWPELDRVLADWHAPRGTRPGNLGARRSLAGRGAPLKVGARALWLLSDRRAPWLLIDRCLDHALVALARYDDLCDWEADLEAGRWNAFVASCGGMPQMRARRSTNRSRVLVAMMVGGAASRGFDAVAAEAREAARLARELGSEPLARHLIGLADRASAQGHSTEAHFDCVANRATAWLFGPAPMDRGRTAAIHHSGRASPGP